MNDITKCEECGGNLIKKDKIYNTHMGYVRLIVGICEKCGKTTVIGYYD